MASRRSISSQKKHDSDSDSEPDHDHGHNHGHSHSIFSSHTHDSSASSATAEKLMSAFQGRGSDRGTQITLVGLVANIALTAIKGAAGYFTHSAALIADAGHSLSDLLGDGVTLVCWRLSRKPPSEAYPFGFAKFETLGTTTVALFLVGGALGLGFHSYHLLLSTLSETASNLPAGPIQELLTNVTSAAPTAPSLGHAHGHSHSHGHDVLNPNALWFAALGVIAKEWLYRITKSVADQENSSVLLANAIHHRSDAYSSLVMFFAILGTWWFPALPLDPLGGMIVSAVIMKQSVDLLYGVYGDLTDAGIPRETRRSLKQTLDPLLASSPSLLAIRQIRGRRAGSLIFVDLTAEVPNSLSIHDATALEGKISETIKAARREVAEVRVKFQTVD
ncbi:CDF-like metal transporter [Roridomyces roridus]|uniref:CDF-like metal transporter n=1 Tax=Roridomyces roridus TaxID=1738132 RepID=A0AAD7G0F7_9AGAR|nr:CDF-like metal transporter [Roridomyces roridus]